MNDLHRLARLARDAQRLRTQIQCHVEQVGQLKLDIEPLEDGALHETLMADQMIVNSGLIDSHSTLDSLLAHIPATDIYADIFDWPRPVTLTGSSTGGRTR